MQTSEAYFTRGDHAALSSSPCVNMAGAQGTTHKLYELHKTLYHYMRERNLDLHTHWDKTQIISGNSAASRGSIEGLTIPYLRSQEQAMLVERLMGREVAQAAKSANCYRHPIIELRITPEHFAIELIMNPISWWDQRNLIGKLAISRHHATLHRLIRTVDTDFRFGFWGGIDLSDNHLTSYELTFNNVLEQWMSTFGDGQDWLRIGVWYEVEDPRLNINTIVNEILERVGTLYDLYSFMLWTSNNNFHSFYHSGGATGNSQRIS